VRYFKNALLLIILMRLDSNLFRHSELMEKCNILMYIQTLHVSSLILERSVLEGITNIYIYFFRSKKTSTKRDDVIIQRTHNLFSCRSFSS
jgi:hypothetical protein